MSYCFSSKNYFKSIQRFAYEFLEDIFKEAEQCVNDDSVIDVRSSSSETMWKYGFKRISKTSYSGIWPTVKEFTVENGARSINGFLSSFYMMEEWVYAVYFIKKITEQCSDLYQYQVIWSIPTPLFPIAQVTASMFFTIEVSKIVPGKCPVRVTFKFETNDLVHTPEDAMNIDDDCLNWILDAKLAHFCRFKF